MHELERVDDDLVGAAGRVAVTARQGPAAVVTVVRRRRGAVRGAVRRERDRAHARHGDALGVERGAHDVVDRVDGGVDEHVRQLLAGRRRHLRALVEALRLEVEEQVAAALRLRARADVDVDHARALLLGGGSVVGDDERDLRLRVELVQVLGRGEVSPASVGCDVMLVLAVTARQRRVEQAARPVVDVAAAHAALEAELVARRRVGRVEGRLAFAAAAVAAARGVLPPQRRVELGSAHELFEAQPELAAAGVLGAGRDARDRHLRFRERVVDNLPARRAAPVRRRFLDNHTVL